MQPESIALAIIPLDESDIQTLLGCSRLPELAGMSPDFACWLRQLLHVEMKRRDGEDVEFPLPDLAGWTDKQVADGVAAAVLLESSTVSEPADHFARQLTTLMALHSATRLHARTITAAN